MKTAILNLFTAIARMLVPFVSYFAGYNAGQDDKDAERLNDENKALRNEIERINNRPITDNDVNRLLERWKPKAKD